VNRNPAVTVAGSGRTATWRAAVSASMSSAEGPWRRGKRHITLIQVQVPREQSARRTPEVWLERSIQSCFLVRINVEEAMHLA